MDAFFLINKPYGESSFSTLFSLRKRLGEKKIGHTGTLDPLATGCLLMATGAYTKLIPYLEKDTKEYIAELSFGATTESYDAETEPRYLEKKQLDYFETDLSLEKIQTMLETYFLGIIDQIPPKYSAIWVDGKRAYEKARLGQDFSLSSRKTQIFEIEILEFSFPKLRFRAVVSAGTYLRSLCYDIGKKIGCGAYMTSLVRTKIQHLSLHDASSIENIDMSHTIPVEKIFGERCVFFQDETIYTRLKNGQRIKEVFPFPENIVFFLYDGQVIRYICEYKNGVLHPLKKIF